jgi:DNA invertase Pin-like site-specific DNA recombinase
MPGLRVAEYGRVSGHQQERDETIETQIFDMDRWITERGHTLAGRYMDLNCRNSIPVEKREDGGRLLRDAAAGMFDIVLVHNTRRWSRRAAVWEDARQQLRKLGVELECVSRNISDQTTSDRLCLNVQLAMDQWEGESIIESCMNGKYRRAHEWASYLGGVVPWGYDVLPDLRHGDTGDRRRNRRTHLEPDVVLIEGVLLEGQPITEASVTKWMYERKARDCWTHIQICAALNCAHIPTPTQNARGRHRNHTFHRKVPQSERHVQLQLRQWNPDTVGKILRNPIYKGRRDYGSGRASGGMNRTGREPVRQQYPPIVSEELWQQAQDAMQRNEDNFGRNRKRHRYLLRGLIFCTHCVSVHGEPRRFVGWTAVDKKHGKETTYYLCPSGTKRRAHYRDGISPCPFNYLRADQLELALWGNLISDIQDSEGTLARIRGQASRREEQYASLQRCRDQVRALQVKKERAKGNTIAAMSEGVITREEARVELERQGEELTRLQTELVDLDRQLADLSLIEKQIQAAGDRLSYWRAKVDQPFTWDEKRQLIEQFVKEILVQEGPDGEVEILYRFCYDPNPAPIRLCHGIPISARDATPAQGEDVRHGI